MFIDIDNFKDLNTKLGHVYCDKVLAKVAWEIMFFVNKLGVTYNKTYRWGGDEFVVIIEETDKHKFNEYCETLISYINSECNVQISIGGCHVVKHEDNMFQCLEIADKALLTIKSLRKNSYKILVEENL